MTENNLTFEQELQMLEAIVGKLEQGDVPLEEALAQFQKGVALSKKIARDPPKCRGYFD